MFNNSDLTNDLPNRRRRHRPASAPPPTCDADTDSIIPDERVSKSEVEERRGGVEARGHVGQQKENLITFERDLALASHR